jgi:hypothetical protein
VRIVIVSVTAALLVIIGVAVGVGVARWTSDDRKSVSSADCETADRVLDEYKAVGAKMPTLVDDSTAPPDPGAIDAVERAASNIRVTASSFADSELRQSALKIAAGLDRTADMWRNPPPPGKVPHVKTSLDTARGVADLLEACPELSDTPPAPDPFLEIPSELPGQPVRP